MSNIKTPLHADKWYGTRVIKSPCWSCGKELDGATGKEGGPSPGDFSLCVECGELNVYDDNLKLRKPTDDEREDAESDPGFMEMKNFLNSFITYMKAMN